MATPFAFDRAWDFAVPPEDLWATLARTDRYTTWWPWLRELHVEGDGLATGTVARPRDPGATPVPAALHAPRARRRSAPPVGGRGHRRPRRAGATRARAVTARAPRHASRGPSTSSRRSCGRSRCSRDRRSPGPTTGSSNGGSRNSRSTRSRSRPAIEVTRTRGAVRPRERRAAPAVRPCAWPRDRGARCGA